MCIKGNGLSDFSLTSIAYKTLKKIIFECWMVRRKSIPAPSPATTNCAGGKTQLSLAHLSWVWSSLKLWSSLTDLHLENTLNYLVGISQCWPALRFQTQDRISESGMCKISSAFIYVFIYLYFLPTLLKACPNLFRSRNWTESSQSFWKPLDFHQADVLGPQALNLCVFAEISKQFLWLPSQA